MKRVRAWSRTLGPGVITGASDDDPSGIATYSQAGAITGFSTLWIMLLAYPMMATIQLASAEIGRVSGGGLAENMKKHYPKWVAFSIVALMLVANTVNIGADVVAMGEASRLVFGGNAMVYSVLLTVASIVLMVWVPYRRYVFFLKWMTLALFAYFGVLFFVHVPWSEVARSIVVPTLELNTTFFTAIIALLGTTISPYLFFWQASEEVEEEQDDPEAHPLRDAPSEAAGALRRIKLDTLLGVAYANVAAMVIMIVAAVTLHHAGGSSIQTAAEAAQALRPLAGDAAFALFAIGIVGTGMLALPVLAGSAAFALAELFDFERGLEKKPSQAKNFYSLIALITIAGAILIFFGVNPIDALYWAAVVNGLVAVPIMAIMMLMGANERVMSRFTLRPRVLVLGWISTGVMLAAAVGLLVTL
ncbi:MAG: divalent metal cation transporter [Bacteroidetes bacterium]|nr:divalent metal cation transporter [Bacteroidota bacterium]